MSVLNTEAKNDYINLLATYFAVSASLADEKELDEIVNNILYTKINSPADVKKMYGMFFTTGDGWRVSRITDPEVLAKLTSLKKCKEMAVHIASKVDEGFIQNEDIAYLSGETCVTKDNVDTVNEKMYDKVMKIHGADNIQGDRVTEQEVKNKNNGENKMNENKTKETEKETLIEGMSTLQSTGNVTNLSEVDEGIDWMNVAKYAAVAVGVVAIGAIAYNLATKENDVIIIDSNDL